MIVLRNIIDDIYPYDDSSPRTPQELQETLVQIRDVMRALIRSVHQLCANQFTLLVRNPHIRLVEDTILNLYKQLWEDLGGVEWCIRLWKISTQMVSRQGYPRPYGTFNT